MRSLLFVLSLCLFATLSHAGGPPTNRCTLTITVNGQRQQVPFYGLGDCSCNGDALRISYNVRGYVGKPGGGSLPGGYYSMPMLGTTLSYDIDMSQVAVGCNAVLYTVTMPASPNGQPIAGEQNDYYCDANQVGGYWCAEMDLIEANAVAMAMTPHKCDTFKQGPCDKGGCSTNVKKGSSWFGAGGKIDPARPFHTEFTFVGSGSTVQDIKYKHTQNGQEQSGSLLVGSSPACTPDYLSKMAKDFSEGMVFVVSYWGSSTAGGMKWLDGDANAVCRGSGTSFTVSNITLGAAAPPDKCQPNPCQNGGTCNSQSGSCTCTSEWSGNTCTQAVSNPCNPNPCQNGGTCNNGQCNCPSEWKGDAKCSTRTPTNPCNPNPCQNGGTCNGGSCTCPAAWKGDSTCSKATPSTDKCNPNPCQNGGTCNGGACTCPAAWKGDDTCSTRTPSTDKCNPNPCQNGGTCNAGVCTCPAAWKGDSTCSKATTTNKCSPNPCQNGGTCVSSTGRCNCPEEWAGDSTCSTPTNNVEEPSCDINNGGCGSRVCAYADDGTIACQEEAPANESNDKSDNSTLLIVIIIGVVIVIAVIIGGICLTRRNNDYPQATYTDFGGSGQTKYAPYPPQESNPART